MRQLTGVASFSDEGIVCEMCIVSHWTYPLHFPDHPILPGSLIIEAAGQATALWAWLSGQRGRPRMVNFGAVSVRIGDQEIATVANCIAVI